jgi:hypothetical protein
MNRSVQRQGDKPKANRESAPRAQGELLRETGGDRDGNCGCRQNACRHDLSPIGTLLFSPDEKPERKHPGSWCDKCQTCSRTRQHQREPGKKQRADSKYHEPDARAAARFTQCAGAALTEQYKQRLVRAEGEYPCRGIKERRSGRTRRQKRSQKRHR